MKIIIVGVGKVGSTLALNFINEGHDVVVVDTEEKNATEIVNKYDANGVIGSSLSRDTLIEAGIVSADFFIACTPSDETNILSSVLAKKLGAKYTIARVRDPLYFDEMDNLREDFGLDLAFNPELNTANDIAEVLKFPSAKSVESFADGKASLVEFGILSGNPLIGKSLIEINKEFGSGFLFGMVKRGDKTFIPKGETVILENDSVFLIATETELTNLTKKLNIFKHKIKSVFIVGGGKIAYYLSKRLLESGITVKIMETDKNRCKELSELLPSAVILNGDGTNQEVLDEEGLKDSGASVTLTGMDEENVLISLYAKQQNVKKVITKVDRPSIGKMVNQIGLDTVVSPRVSIANHILRFIRTNGSYENDNIRKLYKLTDDIEAVEYSVGADFKKLNIPLKNFKIKKEVLIGGIVRDNNFILPYGDSQIQVGDKVIIVSSLKLHSDINAILK